MEEFIASIQATYGLEKDAAAMLAGCGSSLIAMSLKAAGAINPQMAKSLDCSSNYITSSDAIQSLAPISKELKKLPSYCGPWIIPVAGNGDCCPTSLRGSQEKEESIRYALQMIEDGKTENDVDVEPHLECIDNGDNHTDGHIIRRITCKWYDDDHVDIPLPSCFGHVEYEDTEDGMKVRMYSTASLQECSLTNSFSFILQVLKNRPMTRGDLIVLETQYASKKDVDMGMTHKAVQQRHELCKAYLEKIQRTGQWASTPMLVAFAHLRIPSRVPIRIYQVLQGKLVRYMDIVPEGSLPLPSLDMDDILEEPTKRHSDMTYDDTKEDDEIWKEDDTADDSDTTSEATEEDQGACETIFTRLLFSSPGHYDVLVSDAEYRILTTAFPSTAKDMKPLLQRF